MKGTIKLGVNDVEMVANAASPFIYRSIFKEDFLAKTQEENPDAGIIQKMGFVMVNQAKTGKMSELLSLTYDDFLEWLTQYDPLDLIEASGDISDLYMAQTKTLSNPKEKAV